MLATIASVCSKGAQMEARMIQIDRRFASLIPPHGKSEIDGLEKSLEAEGCRDALVTWRGTLIDGHTRLKICRRRGIAFRTTEIDLPDRASAEAWIIRNQMGRRNLPIAARCALACKLQELVAAKAKDRQRRSGGAVPQISGEPPIDTRKVLAKIAGVSHDTMSRYLRIRHWATPEQIEMINCGKTTICHIYNELRAEKKRLEREAQRNAAPPDQLDKVIVGDFRDSALPDNSLSLIIADPSYASTEENYRILEALAEFASKKLCAGGSLVSYVGHIMQDRARAEFGKRLQYHWQFCALREHGRVFNKAAKYRVLNRWRSILWYTKGDLTLFSHRAVCDVLPHCPSEKQWHQWQQPVGEATYLIESICPPNGVVCDPTLGSGTTAVAAERCGRPWIGYEIDPRTARIAVRRIRDERNLRLEKNTSTARSTGGKDNLL